MRLIISFLLLILMDSCKESIVPIVNIDNANEDVMICNEGNFKWINASISQYNPNTKKIVNGVFKKQNNLPLGDVCQSAYFFNDKYYIVLNNSGKISVLDKNYKKQVDIKGFSGARYFSPITNKKAYVSDMYANKIFVVNLESNTITKSIKLSGWNNQLVSIKNKTYVTNIDRSFLYIIDNNTDEIVDSMDIGKGATFIQKANDHTILVLKKLHYGKKSINPELLAIDVLSDKIIWRLQNDSLGFLAINKKENTYFFSVSNRIYKSIGINKIELNNPIINGNWINLYAMSVSSNGEIYISDANDFVSHGEIYRFSGKGLLLDRFTTGIIPSFFCFRQ